MFFSIFELATLDFCFRLNGRNDLVYEGPKTGKLPGGFPLLRFRSVAYMSLWRCNAEETMSTTATTIT